MFITAFLRHYEECLFPSPQNAYCFRNLSRLFLEIFRLFERHAQNLNDPKNYPVSSDLGWDFTRSLQGVSEHKMWEILFGAVGSGHHASNCLTDRLPPWYF